MVLIYRNFLILDRNEPIQDAVSMAQRMGVWFNDGDRVWHKQSAIDKIILVYQDPFRNDDTIREYKMVSEVDFKPQTCVGYIQIYCQHLHVKVGTFQFMNNVPQEQYWIVFKQFLIQLARNRNRNMDTYTLHWDRKLCNRQFQQMISKLGLLSNKDKKTYEFQQHELNTQPQNNNWNFNMSNNFSWS